MKRSALLLPALFLALAAPLAGCGLLESEEEPVTFQEIYTQIQQQNRVKVTIDEGLWGSVIWREGDWMPSVGPPPDRRDQMWAVSRELVAYRSDTLSGWSLPGDVFSGSFYRQISLPEADRTVSDAEGFYQFGQLGPGTYDLATVEPVDALRRRHPSTSEPLLHHIRRVTIRSDSVHQVDLFVDYMTAW
jgi:hypothetical protein